MAHRAILFSQATTVNLFTTFWLSEPRCIMVVATAQASPLILTAEQAAAMLSIKVYTLQQLTREGKVRSLRLRGNQRNPRGIRYAIEDLQAYVARLRENRDAQ